jgi:ribosomal-protein-alanine N-acetyltransferase
MQHSDLDAVLEIEQAANPFPWTLGNFKDCLNAGHNAWVFHTGTQLIAYTIVQSVLDEAHLLNICVAPEHQRKGYGKQILQHVIDFARDKDAALIVLEVRNSNYRAQQLYEQFGFNQMSVRRGYYPAEGGREDAILMGLDLDMLSFFGEI